MTDRSAPSTAQIKAMRTLQAGATAAIRPATANALCKKGLVRIVDTDTAWSKYELTRVGRSWIERYIEQTGDGPEDLKARLRFLG